MKSHYNTYLRVLSVLLVLIFNSSYAQVGIGTVTPDGVLDLNSDKEKNATGTNKYGLVLPRVALSKVDEAAPVINPKTGLNDIPIGTVVYNTATTSFGSDSVYPGIYMWDGIDWINEFPKKNAEIFKQSSVLRTVTTGSYQDIPNLVGRTFTPAYSGTYKIEISMLYGGGYTQNLSGGGTDVGVQEGVFKFEFDSDPDELFPAYAWSGRNGGGSTYFDIWEQFTVVIYKDLVANNPYTFSLSFDQTNSDGFEDDGNTNNGRGWIYSDIPCTIEFVFLD